MNLGDASADMSVNIRDSSWWTVITGRTEPFGNVRLGYLYSRTVTKGSTVHLCMNKDKTNG